LYSQDATDGGESVGQSSGAVQGMNICAMGTKLETWSYMEVCSVIQCLRMNDETYFPH